MTQFKEKGDGPGVGERRAVRLPGAHGGRHPRSTTPTRSPSATTSASTSSWPATSRSGSTTASATRSWSRRRRSRRSAPASWTCRTRRRRCRSRPTRPQGTISCSTSPKAIAKKIEVRGHRLRRRGPLRPGDEARRLEPARRSSPPPPAATIADGRGRVRGRRLRRVQGGGRRRGGRVRPPAAGAVRGARARPRPRSTGSWPRAPARAEEIAAPVIARVRDAAGLLPPRDELATQAPRGPLRAAVAGARVRPGRVLQRRGLRDRDDAARRRHRHPRTCRDKNFEHALDDKTPRSSASSSASS